MKIYSIGIFLAMATGSLAASVNNPMPLYFSGTACRATGSLDSITAEGYPTKMNLWIGGELAAHWETDLGPDLAAKPDQTLSSVKPQKPSDRKLAAASIPRALSVMFDSPHFANGTQLEVRFEAWTNKGYFTNKKSAPVKNIAAIFGRYDLEVLSPEGPGQKGIPAVVQACNQMQINSSTIIVPTTASQKGWPSSWYYSALQQPVSVAYIHTHGERVVYPPTNPYDPSFIGLWSDLDELSLPAGTQPPTEYMIAPQSSSGGSVQSSRQQAMGSGLPPFNSSGLPPIWLAFNDACITGRTNAYAEAYLWPYQNAYGGWCENQASCGWTIYKSTNQTKACIEVFWSAMASGWDTDTARVRLYFSYQGDDKPTNERALVHVYGDFCTRLHGVYTAQLGQESRWVR